jgi:hypothetical protein
MLRSRGWGCQWNSRVLHYGMDGILRSELTWRISPLVTEGIGEGLEESKERGEGGADLCPFLILERRGHHDKRGRGKVLGAMPETRSGGNPLWVKELLPLPLPNKDTLLTVLLPMNHVMLSVNSNPQRHFSWVSGQDYTHTNKTRSQKNILLSFTSSSTGAVYVFCAWAVPAPARGTAYSASGSGAAQNTRNGNGVGVPRVQDSVLRHVVVHAHDSDRR